MLPQKQLTDLSKTAKTRNRYRLLKIATTITEKKTDLSMGKN